MVWTDAVLGIAMFTLMFGMGLTLHSDDFRRILGNPRATVVGTLLQLVAMPIVGLGLVEFFGLSPLIGAGVVVIAACPGGMFSNMYVHLARGNTALSVTLTATATLVTLFTLPLWLKLAIATNSTAGADAIEMPILETALRLGTLTILPVGLGMLTRRRWPIAITYERRFTTVGAIAVCLAVALEAGQRPDLPVDEFVASLFPAAAFAASALVVGISVPMLFRIPARDAVTIAVELIVKNTLLGLALVGQVLEFEALLPIFAFGLFQTPCAAILLVGWRLLEKRRSRSGLTSESGEALEAS